MTQYNVRSFGATGDGVTDDHDAIRAAIAAAEAVGGGTIYFPTGVYVSARHESLSGFFLNSDKPLVFYGDGMNSSVIRMAPGAYLGDFYLFRVESDDVEFLELTLDGNRANISSADEQTHLIQARDQKRLVCRRVEFRNAYGDGIKAVGSGSGVVGAPPPPGALVDEMLVEGCTFRNTGRSGVTIQRAVRDARILGNFFTGVSDQSIDFEPSGATAPSRLIIQGNIIEHSTLTQAVTFSGVSDADRTTDIIFEGNIINNGACQAINTRNLIIRGNIITAPPNQRCLDLSRGHENTLIQGNRLTCVGQCAIYMAATGGRQPVGAMIQDNEITTSGNVVAILLESCADMIVSNNRIVDAAGGTGVGIQARATAPGFPTKNHLISSNIITGYNLGISIAASVNEGCADIVVEGNLISAPQAAPPGKTGIAFTVTAVLPPAVPKTIARATAVGNHAGVGIGTPLVGLAGAGPAQSLNGSM